MTRRANVHAPELACVPLVGWRIVADPSVLDHVRWPKGSMAVRISPDDVFLIGAAEPSVTADAHAIVTPEHGFAGIDLSAAEVIAIAEQHIEWELPSQLPALAQGQVAGVPAKLVRHADGSALLLVACAASNELVDRLNR
ncbi:MAG: hypothetical protein HY826_14155 [Actinobacteria bacterium]|nr:hypothetical protein [Actinomycetota bacterium]